MHGSCLDSFHVMLVYHLPEYSNRIWSEKASVFTSKNWNELSKSTGIEIRLSAIRGYSSLGIGEWLHGTLCRVFSKANMDSPSVNDNTLLKFAVEAENDTIEENVLISYISSNKIVRHT